MKRAVFAIALFSSLAASTLAYAQFGGGPGGRGNLADEAIEFRQSLYSVVGWYSRQLDGMAKGDTKAKSEIWSDPTGFKKDIDAFQQAAAKLADVAGDANAFKSSFGDLGKTCKSCHDDYRKKRF